MEAVAIATAVSQLITNLLPLVTQAFQAQQAGDQATLDALHNQVVAASNALAPAGGAAALVVD